MSACDLPAQPVDATQALNLSAGVSNFKVSRGRSFILGSLAEFERELIIARTGEGRKQAMANGVKFGRPVKLTPHQKREAIRRRDAGEPHTAIARDFNVSHQTIGRLQPSSPT